MILWIAVILMYEEIYCGKVAGILSWRFSLEQLKELLKMAFVQSPCFTSNTFQHLRQFVQFISFETKQKKNFPSSNSVWLKY